MKRRLTSLSLCASLVLSLAQVPELYGKKDKQTDSSEVKIRLMGEALLARDQGDFVLAQKRLEELLTLGSQEPQVQQLLQSVKTMAAQAAAAVLLPKPQATPLNVPEATVVPQDSSSVTQEARVEPVLTASDRSAPAVAAAQPLSPIEEYKAKLTGPADVEVLVRLESERQQALRASALQRLSHVQQLANEGRHAEALASLREFDEVLPINPYTQPVRQQFDALRIDLEHRATVAALTPGIEPPRLSLKQEPAPERAALMDVELQFIELPVEVVDDLWKAWVFFSEDTLQGNKGRMHLNAKGRQVFLRQGNRIPSQRQQHLIWAFQQAKAKPGSGAPLQIREGVSGLVAILDSAPIVRVLSEIDGCRVLGSPKFESVSGQKTHLTFTPEVEARASLMEGPRRIAETRIGWQMEVLPELKHGDMAVAFDISPRVNRYEGFVVSAGLAGGPQDISGEAKPAQSVYSSHALNTQVEVPVDSTLMLAGLIWDEGAPHHLKPGILRQLPVVGHYVRLKETAGRQTELLVFVRAKKH